LKTIITKLKIQLKIKFTENSQHYMNKSRFGKISKCYIIFFFSKPIIESTVEYVPLE
jgi:hypothetical protein